MHNAILRLVLAPAVLLATACGPVSTIAPVRKQAVNSTVTVEGVVTAATDTFQPNDHGFAIQDSKAGIYIQDSQGNQFKLGDRVRVTGTLRDGADKVLGIAPTTIDNLGTDSVPAPKEVTTQQVGEGTEGLLVQLTGSLTDNVFNDQPYGYKFPIDDGSGPVLVYVYAGTHLDVSGYQKGQKLKVIGFSGQYVDHYEVRPRIVSDLSMVQ